MKDAVVSSTSTVTRRTVVAVLATISMGIFVAGATIVVAPRHASALAAYTQKEGKPCGYCHVNAAGGGAKTEKGKEYQANGHKFK